jgi:hypothetical protein
MYSQKREYINFHIYVSMSDLYIPTYFSAAEYADRSLEYINRSHTQEYGNWDWGSSFLFWEYLLQIFGIMSLQCSQWVVAYSDQQRWLSLRNMNSANSKGSSLPVSSERRVYRVPGFLSSHPIWVPHPLTRKRVLLPPLVPRGGHTHLWERGWEEPIWTKGRTLWYSSHSIIPLWTEPMRHKVVKVPRMPQCLPLVWSGTPSPSLVGVSNCIPPSEPKEEGTHWPAGEGVGWSQFGRLEKKPSTTLCYDAR